VFEKTTVGNAEKKVDKYVKQEEDIGGGNSALTYEE